MNIIVARSVSVVVVVVLCMIDAINVVACPSCKEGLRPGSAEAAAGEAFSISVLFMLAVPMLIVGTFAAVLVKKMKQTETEG
jgi:hypothetical protein